MTMAEIDWKEKRIDTLIDAAGVSIQRARSVFMSLTIVGIILLVAAYNSTLPVLRHSVYSLNKDETCQHGIDAKKRFMESTVLPNDKKAKELNFLIELCPVKEQQKKELTCQKKPDTTELNKLSFWIDLCLEDLSFKDTKPNEYDVGADDKKIRSQLWEKELSIIDIPLLGLKIHAYDASFIGVLAMSVLVVWYYFSTRREHYVITEISTIIEKNKTEKDFIRYVFSAVSQKLVFITLDEHTSRIMKGYVKILDFMPCWIPILLFIIDIVTMCLSQYYLRWYPIYGSVFDVVDDYMKIETGIRDFFVLVFAGYNYLTCKNIANFQKNIRKDMLKIRSFIE
jgi:hypothetical protein